MLPVGYLAWYAESGHKHEGPVEWCLQHLAAAACELTHTGQCLSGFLSCPIEQQQPSHTLLCEGSHLKLLLQAPLLAPDELSCTVMFLG